MVLILNDKVLEIEIDKPNKQIIKSIESPINNFQQNTGVYISEYIHNHILTYKKDEMMKIINNKTNIKILIIKK